MHNVHSSVGRYLKITLKVASAVILLCVAAVACILYLNWHVERRAREFCDEIAIGSDISTATARAKERKVFWGSAGGYTFYFPGFAFDKAVCAVSVDQGGKVVSKHSEMEYD
jgi:hypothetical protein